MARAPHPHLRGLGTVWMVSEKSYQRERREQLELREQQEVNLRLPIYIGAD